MSKKRLFQASKEWDAEQVASMLKEAPRLAKVLDARGRTPLHICAARPLGSGRSADASIQTAKELLNGGVALNAIHEIPDDGEVFPATALWYAVARGVNHELVQALLSAGADPDHCLWAAVWANDVEMLRMLLKAGSRTELRFDGETPLLYAAKLGREASLRELLRWKANSNVRDSKGWTPLEYAVKKRLSQATIEALRE